MADVTRTRMLADEFLALPETNQPTELIDGAVIVAPSPTDSHQDLTYRLAKLVEQAAAGEGKMRLSPLDVHLDEHNVVQPDLFWVSGGESRCQLGEDERWHGAPDLVVEVLSPGTARFDKVEKFRLYEQHGTREYWVVDPAAQYVEVWRLEEGRFQRQDVYGPEEAFESAVLGGKRVDLKPVFAR